MEVNFKKKDDLNATMTIALAPADYSPAVEKELKKYQKQVAVKGFRAGAAPAGLVKNMYGKSILADEINRLASKALYDYLKENNIDILAQPIESEDIKSEIDIEKGENFLFAFDLGLAPQFELNISSNDKVDRYIIEVDESEIDKEIESLTMRYGSMEAADISEEKDLIYGTLTELNEQNEPLEAGVADKTTSLTPELIKDETLKKQLIGISKDSTLTVDIFKLFNDNESVIANSLGVAKEAVKDLNNNFKLNVTEISRRKPAEVNQELFDKVMGEGVAESVEVFRSKIKENLEAYYKNESDHHIEHMIGHLLADKHEFALPDAFLKRWLLVSKEDNYNADNIEERYAAESKTLKEVLIREKVAAKYEIKIERQDIEDASLGYSLSLFRNYGMQNPDFEFVKKFSDDNLKKEDYVQQMNDIAVRRKVYNKLKEIVSYNEKTVSIEAFYKIIEEHNHQH